MIELLSDPNAWLSLLILTAMEIVLGIDNIVFISILTGRLPPERRLAGRRLGLLAALGSRIVLLMAIGWVVTLDEPFFTLIVPWSGKDLILFAGGLFLLWKGTQEIHQEVEGGEEGRMAKAATSVGTVIVPPNAAVVRPTGAVQ